MEHKFTSLKLFRGGIFILYVVFALCNCSDAQSDQQLQNEHYPQDNGEYTNLRILTYNIFHGERTDGEIDMDLFAEIINQEKPDLVALQEVDKYVRRSGKIDYVLYPRNDQWKVIETKTICRSDASDHCALLAVIEFKE